MPDPEIARREVDAQPPLPPLYQFLLRLADQLGDVGGVVALTLLCEHGKLGGDAAAIYILAVLGVNTGVRTLGGKARDAAGALKPPAAGLGLLALLATTVASALSHRHTGFARRDALRVVAWLSLGTLAVLAWPLSVAVGIALLPVGLLLRSRRVRVALAAAPLAFGLLGCPLPPPDGCTPSAQRCSPAGIPQVCSQTQRWTAGALARPCGEYGPSTRCCRTRSAYADGDGGPRWVYACVPSSACESEAAVEGGAR